MMPMRVCILTAGTGSRLGEKTAYLNKSLVSVAGKPTLTRSIEMFSPDTEFVIVLGHKGELVREYLGLAYPGRPFIFAQVHPFEGPGSGLGLSLLCCKEHLRRPFIFLSCDTLVEEPIPSPDANWMGWCGLDGITPYRTMELADGKVHRINEKTPDVSVAAKAYIGLAGIADHEIFWQAMEQGGAEAVSQGEAYGLRALLQAGRSIAGHSFTWHDTGNPVSLEATRQAFSRPEDPDILEKPDEAIWFVNDLIIKYSDSTKFIASRVRRASALKGFVPDISATSAHMYAYPMVKGEVFSRVVTPALFQKFLTYCKTFWERAHLMEKERECFRATCHAFYHDKTLERVEQFYARFNRSDTATTINGAALPPLCNLLETVDWNVLAEGLPGRFHGDLHFENILWSEDTGSFCFLDWRQDFGGRQDVGDVYYDFAKLMHGLIVNHGIIARGEFSVTWEGDDIKYDFLRRHVLVECQKAFDAWLDAEGYDTRKVYLLTALIYLNIAALHHYPYSLLLYALGKEMLSTCLKSNTQKNDWKFFP
jgi:GTP:adenosylcobinamide-phosphate guanylyltransferase